MRLARLSFDVRHLLAAVALASATMAMPAQATVIFDDGGNHTIDAPFEDFKVYDSPADGRTSVRVDADGDISELDGISASVFGSSSIYIDGRLQGDLFLSDRTRAYCGSSFVDSDIIRGGVKGKGDSYFRLGGGMTIAGDLQFEDTAEADIFSGTIHGDIMSQGSSEIWFGWNVLTVEGTIRAQDHSAITAGGGLFQGAIIAEDSATVTLSGNHFLVDGVPVDYGPISISEGSIEGTMSWGHPLSTTFTISDDAQIVLVPEPSTMLLAVLGCLGAFGNVRRQRQQRPAAE